MVNDPDAELVRRTGAGDQAAARALIARHLPRIVALSRRMLGSASDADDVAQDVFLKVWTTASRWRPGQAKFATWLYRVTMNRCYDRLRKKRSVPLDDVDDPIDMGPLPDTALESRETSAAVEAALAALPERQRGAIALCHYEGMSNIDAAASLEISVEALESLLSRARRTLRARLAPLVEDNAGPQATRAMALGVTVGRTTGRGD